MATESHPKNRTIETSIFINAPLSEVRSTLFDFKSYPSWARYIHKIEPQGTAATSTLAIGQKLVVMMDGASTKPIITTLPVVHVDKNGFAWEGKLVSNLMFAGKHMFLLSDEGNGKTKLRHREEFSGILYLPLFVWSGWEAKSRVSFRAFNESIKAKVEQRDAEL